MHLVYFREKEFIGRKELFKSKSCHLWQNLWERMAGNGYSLLFSWVLLLLFQCQVQNCTQQLFKCRDIYRGLSFALAFLTDGKKEERKLHSALARLHFIHSDYSVEYTSNNLLFPPAKKRRALSGRIETPCLWYFWSFPLMANSKQMQQKKDS